MGHGKCKSRFENNDQLQNFACNKTLRRQKATAFCLRNALGDTDCATIHRPVCGM
jgi:hypothetical protein